jgi:hypothetical protein
MDSYVVRALVALLLAALLFFQARATSGQPHRRRAFLLAAVALLTFAGYNGALAAGAAIGPFQIALAIAGMALFVGAVVSLVLSWSAGELRAQRERIAAAAR